MRISKQERREARELFRSCVANGAMDEARARAILQRVIAAKPRGYIAILSHFQRLVRLEVARLTARIESAAQLASGEEAALRGDLTRRYGPGLDFIFTQNTALIGGVRIQVGGDVYDGSVESRLEALRQSA